MLSLPWSSPAHADVAAQPLILAVQSTPSVTFGNPPPADRISTGTTIGSCSPTPLELEGTSCTGSAVEVLAPRYYTLPLTRSRTFPPQPPSSPILILPHPVFYFQPQHYF